ncbi:MAG: hypothetical protein ACJA2Q_000604 [Pseudohongiellaceae bacterium]|jgi:hypothetical protein
MMLNSLQNITQKLLAAMLGAALVVTTALVFAPNRTALLSSKFFLASSDIVLSDLKGLTIGWGGINFDGMTLLISERDSAILKGGRVSFQLFKLLAGKLDTIDIEQIQYIELNPAKDGPKNESIIDLQLLNEVLAKISTLPFDRLAIDSAQLSLNEINLDAKLLLSVQPLALNFNAKEMHNQTFSLSGSLYQDSVQSFEGTLLFDDSGNEVLSSEIGIVITDAGLEFIARSKAQPQKLTNYLQKFTGLQGISSTSDPSAFTFALSYLDAASSTVNFDLTFTEQTPTISFIQQVVDVQVSLVTPLPSSIAGSYAASSQHLLLVLSDFASELDANLAKNIIASDITFKQNSVSCNYFTECDIETSIAAISTVDIGSNAVLENVSAETAILASWAGPVLRVSSKSLAFSLPSIVQNDLVGAADVEVTKLILERDFNRQVFSAQATYLAHEIKLDNLAVETRDLSFSGEIDIKNSSLEVSTNLVLASQLTVYSSVKHNFNDGQGHAETVLDSFRFSQITPLSKLINLKGYDIELIAGTVTGKSEFHWRQAADGKFEIGGPINFTLSDLSGYYDELFFIGFSTAVNADLTQAWRFRSTEPMLAKIATVDIGIPANDIRWDYTWEYSLELENEYSLLSITNLTAAILGGEVSVPRIDFDSNQPQSDSNIVISKLNLETIVALTDYPGLKVDGYISGYLPVSLTDSGFNLSDGLISALSPGGTISYLPKTPARGSNSGLKLVNDALSNYQYSRLDTNVVYAKNGDLTLAVQLQGVNPDMNKGQAINLNVNVTDNIPNLLKSLQASRSINDMLEESLNKYNKSEIQRSNNQR